MILGIDLGSSTSDFVLMENNELVKSFSAPSDEIKLKEALKEFPLDKIDFIAVTGCGTLKLNSNVEGIPVKKVDEIQAIGLGGKFVSNKDRLLVVSLGSGTCIVSVKDEIKHVGGTPVGGKTLLGLSKVLLNTDDFNEIENLAKKGDISRVDLMMEEIYPNGIGLLDSKGSAAHFGDLKNPRREDIALALFNMVGQVIGTVIALAVKAEDLGTVVLTGRLINSELIRKIIEERVRKFYEVDFVIPENSDIATAIGSTFG